MTDHRHGPSGLDVDIAGDAPVVARVFQTEHEHEYEHEHAMGVDTCPSRHFGSSGGFDSSPGALR